jgi:hypothetical protein
MSKLFSAFAVTLALVVSSSSSILISLPIAQAQTPTGCTATTTAAIAGKIANGHAWRKHRSEYITGTVIAGLAMPASPRITTIPAFKTLIQSVMGSTTKKALPKSRKAYWGASTGTIVFHDPANPDCGTAFRPVNGKRYYDNQK